jgi:hypothetical protein
LTAITQEEELMALNLEDQRPTGLSAQERYRRIRTWYQTNVSRFAAQTGDRSKYARLSADYIRDLPPPDSASPAQIEAVFKEVQGGRLEWAYHESDGQYKMAAYAGA